MIKRTLAAFLAGFLISTGCSSNNSIKLENIGIERIELGPSSEYSLCDIDEDGDIDVYVTKDKQTFLYANQGLYFHKSKNPIELSRMPKPEQRLYLGENELGFIMITKNGIKTITAKTIINPSPDIHNYEKKPHNRDSETLAL